MIPISPAPIACALSAADFKERAVWLRELTARALISHHIAGQQLHLSYRAEALADVEKMMQQERQCCGFLEYEIKPGSESVEVAVTVPTQVSADGLALFAHLIPPIAATVA